MDEINDTYGPSGPIAPSISRCERILEGLVEDLSETYAPPRFYVFVEVVNLKFLKCGRVTNVFKHVRRAFERYVSRVWDELAAGFACHHDVLGGKS